MSMALKVQTKPHNVDMDNVGKRLIGTHTHICYRPIINNNRPTGYRTEYI